MWLDRYWRRRRHIGGACGGLTLRLDRHRRGRRREVGGAWGGLTLWLDGYWRGVGGACGGLALLYHLRGSG